MTGAPLRPRRRPYARAWTSMFPSPRERLFAALLLGAALLAGCPAVLDDSAGRSPDGSSGAVAGVVSGPPPITEVAPPEELAAWAQEVCAASALVDGATLEVAIDGIDPASLTLQQRVAREARINGAVLAATNEAIARVQAQPAALGTQAYHLRLLASLGEFSRLLGRAQTSIGGAQSNVDIAEAYSLLGQDFAPSLQALDVEAARMPEPARAALRDTGSCAAFTGFGVNG